MRLFPPNPDNPDTIYIKYNDGSSVSFPYLNREGAEGYIRAQSGVKFFKVIRREFSP